MRQQLRKNLRHPNAHRIHSCNTIYLQQYDLPHPAQDSGSSERRVCEECLFVPRRSGIGIVAIVLDIPVYYLSFAPRISYRFWRTNVFIVQM